MRILAIDASPRRGIVSLSVEAAARAAAGAGAVVEVVRLHDLDIRYCTGCNWCRSTGMCKTEDDLPGLANRIAEADGVIFGTPSYFRRADEATQAVLDRLAGYFGDNGQLKLPGLNVPQSSVAQRVKRAVVITAYSMPEPLATFFGYSTGPVRELRHAFSAGGIKTVGSLSVAAGWRSNPFDDWERDKATSLGRLLVGKI